MRLRYMYKGLPELGYRISLHDIRDLLERVYSPNIIERNPFGSVVEIMDLNLMDWVRLGSIYSIEFDRFGNRTHTKFGVRFHSIAELVRLSSISDCGANSTPTPTLTRTKIDFPWISVIHFTANLPSVTKTLHNSKQFSLPFRSFSLCLHPR